MGRDDAACSFDGTAGDRSALAGLLEIGGTTVMDFGDVLSESAASSSSIFAKSSSIFARTSFAEGTEERVTANGGTADGVPGGTTTAVDEGVSIFISGFGAGGLSITAAVGCRGDDMDNGDGEGI
jgi:hypothetical protein